MKRYWRLNATARGRKMALFYIGKQRPSLHDLDQASHLAFLRLKARHPELVR